jgi:hypothetical protein
MFEEPALIQEFRALREAENAHGRGRAFEQLIRRLFQQAHFKVAFNPGAAAPRQTDLVATYADAAYPIETKWQQKPAGVAEVDEVRTRLRETHASMIGVLISVSGFGDQAIQRVEDRRERPVLLLDCDDLEALLHSPEELPELLRQKRQELMVHGRAFAIDDPRVGGNTRLDRSRSVRCRFFSTESVSRC